MTGQQVAADGARSRRRMEIRPHAEATVHIDADPALVWEVVADVTLQNRWSCEATCCEWLAAEEGPSVGARFRGHNRRGFRRWNRTNEVTAVERGRTLRWQTEPTRLFPDSTEWRLDVHADGSGSEVTESYEIVKMPRGMEVFLYWFNPSHRDRHQDLEHDLVRLKGLVESSGSSVES